MCSSPLCISVQELQEPHRGITLMEVSYVAVELALLISFCLIQAAALRYMPPRAPSIDEF